MSKEFEYKKFGYIFTYYAYKIVSRKIDLSCGMCEKSAKISISMGFFLSFYTDNKRNVFLRNFTTHIDCGDVYRIFLINFNVFLVKGAYALGIGKSRPHGYITIGFLELTDSEGRMGEPATEEPDHVDRLIRRLHVYQSW
jgi:hypothetical protein